MKAKLGSQLVQLGKQILKFCSQMNLSKYDPKAPLISAKIIKVSRKRKQFTNSKTQMKTKLDF